MSNQNKVTVNCTSNFQLSHAIHISVVLIVFFLINLTNISGGVAKARCIFSTLDGEKTIWHGFDRYDFVMDEKTLMISPSISLEGEGNGIKDPASGQRRCIVIVPKKAALGNPWSWRGCYWDHQPQTEIELLHRGFHIAYISANQELKPGKQWDAWYEFLTGKLGLSPKPAFIGMSRGGEYAYMWATTHPDKVTCIYADNPAGNWEIMRGLAGLVINDVPVLHVCGSIDPLLGRFSLAMENIYHQFGGRFSIMIKEGFGHHPHSLRSPGIIADFIEQSFKERKIVLPDFANEKSTRQSFYNSKSIFRFFSEEAAYITCRGPLFTKCHNRYTIEIKDVDAFTTIIAPSKAAPGNPWILRSDFVGWNATVDQDLLDKGYHIVTGAVPYNGDGPITTQWDIIYKYLTNHGFSKKPVLEGYGSSTGEVYAWAIENTDKVSCIYGENPILHSNLAKTQPIDNLRVLANSNISIVHICGSLDPNLLTQTRETEKRYKDLGGKITVIIKEAEEHELTISKDLKMIEEFILKETK